MKPKTVLLIVIIAALFSLLHVFLSDEHNLTLLQQNYQIFGFSISALKTLAISAFIAALMPSLYFSYKMMPLYKHVREQEQNQRHIQRSHEDLDRAIDDYRHGAPSKALAQLEAIEHPRAGLWRGKALMTLGRPEQAMVPLREAFDQDHSVEAGYLLAECLRLMKESPEQPLRELIANSPKQARNAYLQLIEHLDMQADWATCIELIKQMESHKMAAPEGALTAYRYEWVNAQPDLTPKRKIEHYQKVLKESPNFVPANLALGDMYQLTGAVEKAFRVYEQAFGKTRNTVFLERLEHFYIEQGHPEDAIQVYRQLLAKTGDLLIKYQLGQLYYKLEMLDESYDLLNPLRAQFGGLPGFLYSLAEIESRRRRDGEALSDLKTIVQQGGMDNENYQCTQCQTRYKSWQARCNSCRQWDKLRLSAALIERETNPSAPIYY